MKEEKSDHQKFMDEFHELNQKSKVPPRQLKTDGKGVFLLDPLNPHDILWMEDDESYDLIPEEKKPLE